MNNIRATKKLNEVELENALRSGATGASWHDEYKGSAYIFVGGLPTELTEGDVITIFSQFGEIMDINLPREKDSGKRRGFGFLMYEDQRSTVLAVDNLNGADVLGRTIRVDHVKEYKQKRERTDEGEWKDAEEQSLNAAPALVAAAQQGGGSASESDESDEVDQEDPMAAYFAQRRKEEKAKGKGKEKASSGSDRAAEKEAKRLRKEERARKRARKEEKLRQRGPEEKEKGERRHTRDVDHSDLRSGGHGDSGSRSHSHRYERDDGRSSRRREEDRYESRPRHRSRSRSPRRRDDR